MAVDLVKHYTTHATPVGTVRILGEHVCTDACRVPFTFPAAEASHPGMIDYMIQIVGETYGLDYLDHPMANDLWVAAMQRAA